MYVCMYVHHAIMNTLQGISIVSANVFYNLIYFIFAFYRIPEY